MARNPAYSPDHQLQQLYPSLYSTSTLSLLQPGSNQPTQRTKCSMEAASANSLALAAPTLTLAVPAAPANPPLAESTTLADLTTSTTLASPNALAALAPSLLNGMLSSATSTLADTTPPSSCFSRWTLWRLAVSPSWMLSSTCPRLAKSPFTSRVLLV